MTVAFGNRRLGLYIALFLLSATVLGLSAHLASQFLPDYYKSYLIFALVVTSWTIFILAVAIQWSQPRMEAGILIHLAILWVTLGAWTNDVIGPTQCDALGGTRIPTKSGTMSQKQWCEEEKVIQAFSWTIFCFLVIAFIILLQLTSQAKKFGRYNIWQEPIRELGWFGEMPGYYNQGQTPPPMSHMAQSGYPGYPASPGYFNGAGPGMPQYIQQQPGHAIVVQPGINGAPPTITSQPI